MHCCTCMTFYYLHHSIISIAYVHSYLNYVKVGGMTVRVLPCNCPTHFHEGYCWQDYIFAVLIPPPRFQQLFCRLPLLEMRVHNIIDISLPSKLDI